ncbi:hypothetical protein GGQ99_000163 [Aminobacter niigataensis]|uniref:Uncharacterized protein n=1 Tax=Aminobacter niigataensis TaxID=83265 RepID=A0ABR6KVI5_9HYPH|nr:hypothetical protein [Aminobacter niigataensis]MBB4648441.1 hypothetical protein [Aminobacter niigataensis]
MTGVLPWEMHPDLTEDRLAKVAELICRGRNDAVLWQNEEIGDDSWVLGCRAFQACRHQIISAEANGDFPWLSVADNSKHLVFSIGAVPVRFYRGLAEEPTSRTMRQSFPELQQMSMLFPGEEAGQLLYRFAVETDIDGTVTSIKFVGLLGETAKLIWEVPLVASVGAPISINAPADGVELDSPVVGLPKTDAGTAAAG